MPLKPGVIAVGCTGGSGATHSNQAPLSWQQLARDLLLSHQWRKDIYIHSLEGCVRQGFVPYLKNFDWEQSISPPEQQAKKVNTTRKVFRSVLWTAAHPMLILAGVLGLLALGRLIFPTRNRDNQNTLTA